LSFFSWDLLTPPEFVGLANYAKLVEDSLLRVSLANTAVFVFWAELFNVGLGVFIACGINWLRYPRLKTFLQTAYFLPFVMSSAVISLLWGFLMQTDLGVLNYLLSQLGFLRVPWLTSTEWAMRSVILIDIWRHVGFFVMIFLARLRTIPSELYEAAQVDGAGEFIRFIRITIPMLTPTLFFAIIIALIGGFQVFDQMYILTQGGPGDATRSVVMYIYEEAFRSFRMGYASALSMVLFVIIVGLTIIQFAFSRRWVFYR
jgi:multiple sugar transport system permease protein